MDSAARQRSFVFTARQLLVAILFVAIFAMAIRQPADTDTWWHLKSGQLMWESGEILRADSFSHTVQGLPWINHGWLVQLLLWPVYQVLGLAGLALLLAVLVTASFLLVYTQCAGKPFVAAFATFIGAVASSVIWAVRPQIVSLLLAAVVAFLLDRYKRSRSGAWLWPLPLLVALWVNCHGGFVIAFILMGCYLVGETLNRLTSPSPAGHASRNDRAEHTSLAPLVVVILVSIPAVLLNPNTIKMFPYAYQTVSIGQLQDFIQEWSSPDFHNLQFHPFIWLLLLTLAAMGLSRRRADWTDLALVGAFGYMGLLAVRNVALFALVAPPVLSRHAVFALDDLTVENPRLSRLAALTHTLRPPPPRRALVMINLLLLILVVFGAGTKIGIDLLRLRDPDVWGEGLPLEAVEYLREHDPPGSMFNTYNWGGYLIWSLYPDNPVFIDGRTDLYALNGTVLQDYSQVHWVRPGWEEILSRYDTGYLITEHAGLLDTMVATKKDWKEVYRDEVAAIYVRTKGTP
jgi:hypothetical protein